MNKEPNSSTNLKNMFVSLVPIQTLSTGLPMINTLISSCIIGNALGSSALAAIGFAGPFQYIVLIFSNLLGIGSQLLCGRYIGEGNEQKIKEAFSTTTILCTIAGILLALISFCFPSTVAMLLGAKDELLIMTSDYVRGYFLCAMFTVFSSCIIPFLSLDFAKKLTTISIVVQLILNVGLNILNAYVLHWGMLGVGLASSISTLASVIVCVPHFLFKSKIFKFSIKCISKERMLNILSLGWNSALIYVWLFFRDRLFNQVAFAMGGALAISAFTVANNISNSIGVSIQGGMYGPLNIIASVLIGERDVDSLRELPRTCIKTFYPVSVLCYALVFVLSKPICLVFGAKPEDLAVYILMMRIFNLWFLTSPLKTSALGIYNSLKNVKALSVFNFLAMFIYPSLIYILAKAVNSQCLLWSFAASSEALLLITLVFYYKIKTKHNVKSLSNFVYIPRSFAVPKEDSFSATIKSNEDVSNASASIVNFCKEKGMSDKQSFYCGLCLEEVAVDTISKGFPKVKNNGGVINANLVFENGHITMIFRDNCPQFDPNEWLKLHAKDDPNRSIGLKMVSKMATSMEYKTTFGLNVLTIKI